MSFLLYSLGWASALIPTFILRAIAVLFAHLIFYTMRSRRQIMLGNLFHFFPQKTEAERKAIALESCARTIELGMFVLASSHFSKKRIRRHFSVDEEALEEILAGNKPCIVAVPHFSLMESLTLIPVLYPPIASRDCGVFYRPFENAALENWVRTTRERFGFKLLSRKQGLTQALSFFKNNGIICVLFDQSAGRGRGILSLFGGRVTTNSALAGTLASHRDDAQIFATYCERSSFWRGRIKFERISVPAEKTPENYTFAINAWLEKKLKESDNICADWLWLHDRWKEPKYLNLAHKKNKLPEALQISGLKELPRKKRIWIRLPNWLGDIVMAIPLVQTIRKARPDAELTLLARKHFIPMLERLGLAENLIALPAKGKGYWKFCRSLSTGYPEQYYLFTNSLRGDLESFLAGAPFRSGMLRPGKPRPFINVKWKLPQNLDLSQHHQTKVWEQWLRERHELTGTTDFSPIKISNSAPKFRIGLICGTENSPEKRWPIQHWRELIARLQKAFPQLEIFLFGTAKDAQITQQVAERQNEKVIDRAGKTNLPEYMDELVSCRLICGNDTGGMHLANMLGVPVVGIFGPTNPVRTGPIFSAPAHIIQPKSCPATGGMDIALVPAEQVAEVITQSLGDKIPA